MSAKLGKTIVLLAAALTGCELVAGIQDLTYTPASDLEGGAMGAPDSTAGQGDSANANDAVSNADAAGDGAVAAPDAAEAGSTGADAGDAPSGAIGDAISNDAVSSDVALDRSAGDAGDATSEATIGDGGPPADTGAGADAAETGAVTGPPIPGPDGGSLVGADGGVLAGDLIDNIDSEIVAGNILARSGRRGTWFTYDDGAAGGIVPAVGSSPALIVGTITSFSGVTTNKAAHMTGNGAAAYAGMGFNVNALTTAMTYDASAYQGVTFWARIGGDAGAASVQFNVPDRNTSTPGGVCTGCGDYFSTPALTITPAWHQFVVYFNQLGEQGFGVPQAAALDVAHIYSCQFQLAAGAAFDIWVDDIYFIDK